MAVRIALAGGKGGTGKTTLAVGLARAFVSAGERVSLLDLDVEEPNAHLFFKDLREVSRREVLSSVPVVRQEDCTACGRCRDFCRFNAIVVFDKAIVLEEFCHRCGGCVLVCPEGAIEEREVVIGEVVKAVGGGLELVSGWLKVGQANPGPVIREVKAEGVGGQWLVLDCPPGSGCAFVESVEGADLLLGVVEDTPFGAHDFRKAVRVAREMGIDVLVVVNRYGMGNGEVLRVCEEEGIEVLAKVPFREEVHRSLARGIDPYSASGELRAILDSLRDALMARVRG